MLSVLIIKSGNVLVEDFRLKVRLKCNGFIFQKVTEHA
jgi:hypothetical protein